MKMTDIYIIAEVYGGVLNEILAFDTKEKALAYVEDQVKKNDFHKVSDDHWTSRDEDDDMTLWTVSIDAKKPTLEDYRKQITRNECADRCNFKGLKSLPIEHYDHDGGWPVEGFKEKQWLYVTCPKCGYQWALWKLGVLR